MASSYEELIVWQKAMELAEETYQIVKSLPKEELYVLSDQMRRAAISIPSNIAEGQARHSTKEFANFLSIAKGSVAELHTQYLLCVKLQYVTKDRIQKALILLEEVGKMLNSLISKLSSSN